jgi:light-regulated signal transduction histidine kinase (bacteriophytochrome)
MMETAASHAHSRSAIFDFIADYRKMIGSDGLAVWSDEKLTLSGETPTEDEVMDLIGFINRTTPGRICASAEIAKNLRVGRVVPRSRRGVPCHSHLAAPRDCLIFFRREILRSVKWAGDPNKSYAEGPLGPRLTRARASEIVRGQ